MSDPWIDAPNTTLVRDDRDLPGFFNLNSRHAVNLFHWTCCSNRLALEVVRGVADSGCLQTFRAGLGDDHGKVLLVAEVLFRVQVDFTAFLEPVFRGLHRHSDGDLFSNLLAGLDRPKRFALISANK